MSRKIRLFTFFAALTALVPAALADPPDCTGPDRWPAAMAGVYLKNAGMIEAPYFPVIEVERLASEEIGPDMHRQVHKIRFVTDKGRVFNLITVNNASSVECSESSVDVYLLDSQTPQLNGKLDVKRK